MTRMGITQTRSTAADRQKSTPGKAAETGIDLMYLNWFTSGKHREPESERDRNEQPSIISIGAFRHSSLSFTTFAVYRTPSSATTSPHRARQGPRASPLLGLHLLECLLSHTETRHSCRDSTCRGTNQNRQTFCQRSYNRLRFVAKFRGFLSLLLRFRWLPFISLIYMC